MRNWRFEYITCIECGKQFIKDGKRKFCGKFCANQYATKHRKHRRDRNFYHKKIIRLLGNKCILCNSIRFRCIHEIHGNKHPNLYDKKGFEYFLEHKNDFILLCRMHHDAIHELSRTNKDKKNIIITLIEQLQKNALKMNE